ncbi:hypothetical protein EIN_495730 [Entamoeba invadens IP1]|uniref:Mini-chromosome maintenance complex-binding protein n=1 Tax=Entamoeba invadens IP1 TaxID=370355 RepID=A0A0A1U5N0_ENTIV|nr:hypothetical protein EIN_495730 [Entamoeba invadens IP1]ELP87108.1 hypothetical protein EIN_495730 [Entamoeba invadens IP1]|eukprot:XP_004253879.1 hypothetical protein EIN_495730 [Entamoeba invadens IP1]
MEGIIDSPDDFFTSKSTLESTLYALKQQIKDPKFYRELLLKSTPEKLSDRCLVSVVVTVLYELDQQLCFDQANGTLCRYFETADNEVTDFQYLSRNRFLCAIEGFDNPSIPSISGLRKDGMRRGDRTAANVDKLVSVISFEDSKQLKVGERYHIIGIYQSSRYDGDSELEIKVKNGQRVYALLWRKYHGVEQICDEHKVPVEMQIALKQEDIKHEGDIVNKDSLLIDFGVREDILNVLECVVGQPQAKLLFLSLISRVYKREPIILHNFNLLINTDDFENIKTSLCEALSIISPFTYCVDGNEEKGLLPKITNDTMFYDKYPLQVGNDGTVLVFCKNTVSDDNLRDLEDFLTNKNMRIEMHGFDVSIPVNCSAVIVSENGENDELGTLCNKVIKVNRGIRGRSVSDIVNNWNEEKRTKVREYFGWVTRGNCQIEESIQQLISETYVQQRAMNSNVNQDTLHQWITVANLLGNSYGLESVTPQVWKEAVELLNLI